MSPYMGWMVVWNFGHHIHIWYIHHGCKVPKDRTYDERIVRLQKHTNLEIEGRCLDFCDKF